MQLIKRVLMAVLILSPFFSFAQKNEKITKKDLSNLKFRSIGPALMSGRIVDISVNPNDYSEFYLAVASGGVWKTNNAGISFEPVFDSQKSYSIGCVTIDPNNSNVVWVGSGENNNQRSVAYGDGIYKSVDAGKTWKNMGLETSEHIGMISIDPRNSNVVYVAAYGPLWSEGGERGLYKTTDGGKTWLNILSIDENTGVNEVHIDPSNPDIIYATAHQRRRHVFTYIGGGPSSAMYKSVDAGKTWKKLSSGLPSGDVGRIGMDLSPANPEVVYAIVEAKKGKGVYKSSNKGESWEKVNSYSTSGNYYQEIICDPTDANKAYFMDTYQHRTVDGGQNINRWGENNKHVDNHCLWINPDNVKHHRLGTDGGLYESFDEGKTWRFFANLPITQFYKVAVDNAKPFYNIYGGTQDNNSMGGPSQTTSSNGIVNADWFITNGGDGFESAVDTDNPDIVYAQAQYGYLVRFDKKTGEKIFIQPQPQEGEKAFRWNWDAPLIVSPHKSSRLYFAANKLFRSDDRGNTWERVSNDLTQQIDRNKLPVMGKVWDIDAVMKNMSTTIYGNIVALDESPLKENLIYVGTDDGLIQVSEDAKTWRKISKFKGVPENTYVNSVFASQHDVNTVYATFNNHKRGDFKPYILKSVNKGKSWTSISGNLPERGSVYDLVEDHINPNILFAGTEFGVFVSLNSGENWIQLKNGLPTIAVRDIEIQKEENDLVLATFGRSFYVLDDYSMLRELAKNGKPAKSVLFETKPGLIFGEKNPYGGSGKASQGESFFTVENPKQGVNFNYYLSDDYKSLKKIRNEKEKNSDYYPTFDEIRAEANEEKPKLIISIYDSGQNEIKRIVEDYSKGYHSTNWDGRMASLRVAKKKNNTDGGPWVLPGKYYVAFSKLHNGEVTELIAKSEFEIKSLYDQTLSVNREEVLDFQRDVNNTYTKLRNTNEFYSTLSNRIVEAENSLLNSPKADLNYMKQIKGLKETLNTLSIKLHGDKEISKYQYETLPSLSNRISSIIWSQYYANVNTTTINKKSLEMVQKELPLIIDGLKKADEKLKSIEKYINDNNLIPLSIQTPQESEEGDW